MDLKSMLVGGLPTNKMALTNAMYVNPVDAVHWGLKRDEAAYVLVCGQGFKQEVVYEVLVDDVVDKGTLGMNGLQRSTLKLSEGMPVQCRPYTLSSSSSLIAMELEVDVLTRGKCFLDEDELIEFVFRRFENHVFCRDQVVIMDFQGKKMSLLVKMAEMAALEEKSDGHSTKPIGTLVPKHTIVSIETKNKTKMVELKKSQKKSKKSILSPSFNFQDMDIGGLDNEFFQIFRRAFVSRAWPPAIIERMGIKHVRGMLLHGPPGTGKTLIARQIGKMLNGKEPKVVNGPEILSKFVGEAEKNIRELFADAEADYQDFGEESELHIIIFDEIDAICKQRGSVNNGTGINDTVVNQLLSKIDGVDSLNNILVIGMTNRKDMLDEALLRPGRLEVHVEIGLPDEQGRHDIFQIHTKKMRLSGTLGSDVDLHELASMTKNYSGAEIEGVVKDAQSYALSANINALTADKIDINHVTPDLTVSRQHFIDAIAESIPAFGVEEGQLRRYIRNGILEYSPDCKHALSVCRRVVGQLQSSDKTPVLSVLLQGRSATGKTALAAHLAMESGFPYVKLITAEDMVGYNEAAICDKIARVFADAYKSPLSFIVLDDIERLLGYVRIGPRFSNTVLQALLVLIKKMPPNDNCKLMVVGTTSDPALLEDLMLKNMFQVAIALPEVEGPDAVRFVLQESGLLFEDGAMDAIAAAITFPIGIKKLQLIMDMSAHAGNGTVSYATFTECLADYGI